MEGPGGRLSGPSGPSNYHRGPRDDDADFRWEERREPRGPRDYDDRRRGDRDDRGSRGGRYDDDDRYDRRDRTRREDDYEPRGPGERRGPRYSDRHDDRSDDRRGDRYDRYDDREDRYRDRRDSWERRGPRYDSRHSDRRDTRRDLREGDRREPPTDVASRGMKGPGDVVAPNAFKGPSGPMRGATQAAGMPLPAVAYPPMMPKFALPPPPITPELKPQLKAIRYLVASQLSKFLPHRDYLNDDMALFRREFEYIVDKVFQVEREKGIERYKTREMQASVISYVNDHMHREYKKKPRGGNEA